MTSAEWREKLKDLEGEGHTLVLEYMEYALKEHGTCCENVCDTIAAWYSKYATDGKVSYSEAIRLNRMLELMDDVEEDLDTSTEKETNYIDLLLAAILALYSKRLKTPLSLELIKRVWASDGVLYSDRMWNNKTLLLAYINSDLKRALARGDSLPQILAKMRKRFNTSDANLTRLIQTEATAYEADMVREFMQNNGFSKYQWVTILDGKQCKECDVMDGLIFHIEDFERGVTAPPLHSHCRCQISPII